MSNSTENLPTAEIVILPLLGDFRCKSTAYFEWVKTYDFTQMLKFIFTHHFPDYYKQFTLLNTHSQISSVWTFFRAWF